MAYYYNGLEIETPFQIQSDRFFYETTSLALKRQAIVTQAQRWLLNFNVKQNPDSNEGKSEGGIFLDQIQNPFSIKSMIMPQLPSVNRRARLTKARVRAINYAAGADSLELTRAMPAGETDGGPNQFYPKGMFIRFENHSKVYVITEDVIWTTQVATIPIFPRLVQAVPSHTRLLLGDDCLLTYTRDSSTLSGLTFADGIISSPGVISLIEHI